MKSRRPTVFAPSVLWLAVATASGVLPMAALAETDHADIEPTVMLETEYVTIKRDQGKLKESAQKVLIIDRQAIDDQLLLSDDTSEALSKLIPGYAPASEEAWHGGRELPWS